MTDYQQTYVNKDSISALPDLSVPVQTVLVAKDAMGICHKHASMLPHRIYQCIIPLLPPVC